MYCEISWDKKFSIWIKNSFSFFKIFLEDKVLSLNAFQFLSRMIYVFHLNEVLEMVFKVCVACLPRNKLSKVLLTKPKWKVVQSSWSSNRNLCKFTQQKSTSRLCRHGRKLLLIVQLILGNFFLFRPWPCRDHGANFSASAHSAKLARTQGYFQHCNFKYDFFL